MTLTYFKACSDKQAKRRVTIDSPEDREEICQLLQRVPTQGEMMIKMGPSAELLVLEIEGDGTRDEIRFYAGRIKTCDTSFLDRPNEAETLLVARLRQHLRER